MTVSTGWADVCAPPESVQRGGRIAALDGWRAISVALVIGGHMLNHSALGSDGSLLSSYGPLGVSIFFVISGYVITRGLLAERMETGRISLTSFYLRRAFRILPPLVAYVATVLVLARAGFLGPEASIIYKALFFVCNTQTADCGGWYGLHTWSLSTEEQFYLVAPLILAAGVSAMSITASVFCLPFLVIGFYALKMPGAAFFAGHFIAIGFGVLLALHEPLVRKICDCLPRFTWLATILAVAAIWVLPPTWYTTTLKTLVIAPLIGLALVSSFDSAFLRLAPLVYIGRISYGIYIWQQLATNYWSGGTALTYCLLIIGCLLLAAASYELVESRLIRFSRTLSGQLEARNRKRLLADA